MRAGSALPMALFTLSLLGALAVGGAWTARRAAEDARGAQAGLDLERQVEDALADIVAGWDSTRSRRQVGASEVAVEAQGLGNLVVTSTRIGASVHWVVVEGVGTSKPFPRNRIGLLLAADSLGVQRNPVMALFRLP